MRENLYNLQDQLRNCKEPPGSVLRGHLEGRIDCEKRCSGALWEKGYAVMELQRLKGKVRRLIAEYQDAAEELGKIGGLGHIFENVAADLEEVLNADLHTSAPPLSSEQKGQ